MNRELEEIRQRVGISPQELTEAVQAEMARVMPADQLVALLMTRIEDCEALLGHIEAQDKLMERLADGLDHRQSHIYNASCHYCQEAMEAHLDYSRREEQADA